MASTAHTDAPTPTIEPRHWRRGLVAVLACCFGVGLTLGMAAPLVSLTLESWGHSSLIIGMMAAIYSLAILVAGSLVPALMNRFGPVAVMATGLLVAAVSLIVFPLAGSMLLVLFALRFVMGVGGGFDWVASETWITSAVRESNRGRVVALYVTLWGGGLAAGPLILLAVGTEGMTPFALAAGLLCVAVIPVLAARRSAPKLTGGGSGRALLTGLRAAPVAMGASFLGGWIETSFVSLFPIWGLKVGHDESAVVLMTSVFAVGALGIQPPLGWLADKVDRARLLVVVTLLAGLCVAAVALTMGGWGLWPVLFVWGGASAGLYTMGLVVLGQRVKPSELSAANAGFIMSYTLGMVLGPAIGGAAMGLWTPHGLLVVLAVVTAVYLIVSVSTLRPSRPAG